MNRSRKPTATIETGVKVVPIASKTTSYGKRICLAESIRQLAPGQSIRIDDFNWRRRVTATASYLKVRVETQKTEDGKLLITRR